MSPLANKQSFTPTQPYSLLNFGSYSFNQSQAECTVNLSQCSCYKAKWIYKYNEILMNILNNQTKNKTKNNCNAWIWKIKKSLQNQNKKAVKAKLIIRELGLSAIYSFYNLTKNFSAIKWKAKVDKHNNDSVTSRRRYEVTTTTVDTRKDIPHLLNCKFH